MAKNASKTQKTEGVPAKKVVLLDTHAILHRAYHALPDFASSKGDPTGALYGLCTMIVSIIRDLSPDYIIACYDRAEATFRHQAYDAYKGGRAKTDDALISQIIRSHEVIEALAIPIYDAVGFEADDMLGTIVEQTKKQTKSGELQIIIASGDMDTLQLVDGTGVEVYTLKKGISDTILYDEKAVLDRFGFEPKLIADYKGLRGDPSDNIVGIAGIGEKTATDLIVNFGSVEEIYKTLAKKDGPELFKKAGIKDRIVGLLQAGKEEADFSKMLATIRRDAPIIFTLPEKTWKESYDKARADALFKELDFRTMGERFNQIIAGRAAAKALSGAKTKTSTEKSDADGAPDVDENGEVVGKKVKKDDGSIPEGIDPTRFKKAAIAAWLVNSNLTNPTYTDIMSLANTDDFDQAEKNLAEEMKKRGVGKVFNDIEVPLLPVLDMMEKRGVKIDRAYLEDLGTKYKATLAGLEKEIWGYAGQEFNVASPKQLGEILFDKLALKPLRQKKTAGGAKSTKESELEKLRDVDPIIGKILEYRELAKLISTYVDVILAGIDENDRLHTTFIQTGAATGRMASQNPGIQNIPIKTELGRNIRRAFIAEKGFTLVSCDYSQMELRIAAFMSGDEKMIDIFVKGEDVHAAVASQVFGVPIDQVSKEQRRKAKVINFGILYGMGVNALRENLKTDRAEAQEFYNAYFATFTKLAAYLDEVKAETARKGYTETFFGRRRYFEGIKSRLPFIRAMAERMAINAPIQGTGADIIKIAMAKIADFLAEEKLNSVAHMLLQVHDELVFEIKDDQVQEIVPKILKIMESTIDPKKTAGIIIASEANVGENWNDTKPFVATASKPKK